MGLRTTLSCGVAPVLALLITVAFALVPAEKMANCLGYLVATSSERVVQASLANHYASFAPSAIVWSFPEKRLLTIILILYIPVLYLWRAMGKVSQKVDSKEETAGAASLDPGVEPASAMHRQCESLLADSLSSSPSSSSSLRSSSPASSATLAAEVMLGCDVGSRESFSPRWLQAGCCSRERLQSCVCLQLQLPFFLLEILKTKVWNPLWQCHLYCWQILVTCRSTQLHLLARRFSRGQLDTPNQPTEPAAAAAAAATFRDVTLISWLWKRKSSTDPGLTLEDLPHLAAKGLAPYAQPDRHHDVVKTYNRKLTLYRKVPLRDLSRMWGRLTDLDLPVWLRVPTYRIYTWLFGCNVDEMAVKDLKHYRNLKEFFRRRLRPGIRPIDSTRILTSPADGRVLYCGRVEGGVLEQIKGVSYSLRGFMGPLRGVLQQRDSRHRDQQQQQQQQHQPSHRLPSSPSLASLSSVSSSLSSSSTSSSSSSSTLPTSPSMLSMSSLSESCESDDSGISSTPEFFPSFEPGPDGDDGSCSIDEVEEVLGLEKEQEEEEDDIDEEDEDYEQGKAEEEDPLLPGEAVPSGLSHDQVLVEEDFARQLLVHPQNDLFQCIIYLAPGDYHHFHSPADWTCLARRHFPGELFSVSPSVVRWLQGLFSFNERAVYTGRWRYGFFSMTAVGATNVGSINVNFDKKLKTNVSAKGEPGAFSDAEFTSRKRNGVTLKKGGDVGGFDLGSTILLVFEAPRKFQFNVGPGQLVKYGQGLGTYAKSPYKNRRTRSHLRRGR